MPKTRKAYSYVNVYMVDRAYGGPEEGGWWFDTGHPVLSVKVDKTWVGEEDEQRVREALRTIFPNTGKSSSVLGGNDYRVHIEKHPGRAYPTRRPVYC